MTGELIGHLREDDGGVMAFGYSRLWLARTDAIPLAPNLPLDEQWHAGEFVAAYFDNLLPGKACCKGIFSKRVTDNICSKV